MDMNMNIFMHIHIRPYLNIHIAMSELRELLTSPPGAISYVLSATSFYLDISGSAPSIFPRTTDFCSFGCPDDIRSILLLDIEGHRTLTLAFACRLMLPRPTTTALAA
jgi:hypothetical protein